MREEQEYIDDRWLDRLDEIATGMEEPSPEDDELLHLAGQLNAAFAPLRELDAPARAHRHRLGTQLRAQLDASPSLTWKKWLVRPLVAVAALLLFVLLGPGLIFELNLAGNTGARLNGNNSSSLVSDLPSDFSFAILSTKDIPRGLTLLLPTNLGPNDYLVATMMNNYGSSASINLYLIYTQNAHIYESPSQPPPADAYANSSYSTIQLGSLSGILLRTSSGENRIEWYESGLLCDMVSSEPAQVMAATIEQLQMVTY
jgi:hypothetical protein